MFSEGEDRKRQRTQLASESYLVILDLIQLTRLFTEAFSNQNTRKMLPAFQLKAREMCEAISNELGGDDRKVIDGIPPMCYFSRFYAHSRSGVLHPESDARCLRDRVYRMRSRESLPAGSPLRGRLRADHPPTCARESHHLRRWTYPLALVAPFEEQQDVAPRRGSYSYDAPELCG